MITPLSNTPGEQKYKDPLSQKTLVLMSYSNEVGTAISEIAPKLGTALWAPTFMYLGADIYDKYKNDKDSYNPSGKRAFKRAIFQGMTSLIALPAVIYAGQCLVSPLSRMQKSGISGNAKDAVYRHTKDVIDQTHGDALESYEKFKNIITKSLENKLDARKNEKKSVSNFFKKVVHFFTEKYPLVGADKKKLLDFAEDNAKKTFEIAEALKNNDKKKVPYKIYHKYQKLLPKMKEMYKEADYSHHATRTALKEYQNSLIFKNKLLKTVGGFIALGIFAAPVNEFVDKKIMKKYINPGIDQISHEFINGNGSNLKNIFNEMRERKFNPHYAQNEKPLNRLEQSKIQHAKK